MEPYDPDAVCPKCEHDKAWVKYNADYNQLLRTCRHCSYKWNEAPLDAERKAGDDG